MTTYLMSIGDTCTALGLGRTTVYSMINKGELETVVIGRRRLVRVESVRHIAGERTDG